MEQTEATRVTEPNRTDVETSRVFEELKLETREQRDKFTTQSSVVKPTTPVRYVIRLSNSSQPAPTIS